MKIDRLLAITIHLLNRDLVSARELSEYFEVSVRTIQRDMDALCSAGIPVLSVQGSHGGFGIVEGYKLDRQLIDTGDLFFILTALESISSTYKNKQISSTLEKIKTLVHAHQTQALDSQKEKLFIDFSAFSIGKNSSDLFQSLDDAIENNQVVKFTYTNNNLERVERLVEPMTIAFKWFSWYLFGFCRLRNDFRIFRLSRIENFELTKQHFQRKNVDFQEYSRSFQTSMEQNIVDLKLKFHPSFKVYIEDYFKNAKIVEDEEGSLIVDVQFPHDEWLYSTILSYSDKAEVLEPAHIREKIYQRSMAIARKYER